MNSGRGLPTCVYLRRAFSIKAAQISSWVCLCFRDRVAFFAGPLSGQPLTGGASPEVSELILGR